MAAPISAPASVREVDGRRLRRQQNRQAVLDAMAALFAEGNYQPGTAAIAERAGISNRSLFRYFDDMDDLARAAIERQLAQALPMVDVDADPTDPTTAKVAALVASRMRLFATTAPAARAARIGEHRHPVIAEHLAESRAFLRHQIERLFAAELGGPAGPSTLAAADALCSFETYQLMHGDHGMTVDETAAAVTTALTALLAHDAPGGAR